MDWRDQIREIAKGWLFSDVVGVAFPPTVILPLENPDLHDHERFTDRLEDARHARSVSLGAYRGIPTAVMRSKFGAPAVALAVETLGMMGVRDIIGIGFCGALRVEIGCGELILPHEAERDDGTTPRYVDLAYRAKADPRHLVRLRRMLESRGIKSHDGVVWSTDAVLQETSAQVAKWAECGALAVDMECGALFTVAERCGIRAAALLVASDNAVAERKADATLLSAGAETALDLAFAWVEELAAPGSR